jgi:protoheme IX farnesyltransferase
MSEAVVLAAPMARLRDVVELGKPRLSMLVLFTSAIGVWMAGGALGAPRTILFVLATFVLVGAANTLNCWIEREIDSRMHRTRDRPLPAGRLAPRSSVSWRWRPTSWSTHR